jgi:hypothetical protein
MSNTIVVPISNEPTYGFKRTATMAALQINCMEYNGKAIILNIQVDYFNDLGQSITIIPPKIVNLTATGEEYDAYMAMMDEPVVIQDLVIAKIEEADQAGRFN